MAGKIFTILYAMVGIPLCLVLFHSIGERLNKVSSIGIRQIKKILKVRVAILCVRVKRMVPQGRRKAKRSSHHEYSQRPQR